MTYKRFGALIALVVIFSMFPGSLRWRSYPGSNPAPAKDRGGCEDGSPG